MEIDKIALGNRIRSIRLEKSMNLKEFGFYIDNTSDSIVSRWEKGKSVPNAKRLKLIANAGGISVDELLYGSYDSFAYSIYSDIMNEEYTEGYLRFEASALKEIYKSDGTKFKKIFDEALLRIKELGYTYSDTQEIKEIFYDLIFEYYHNEEPTNSGLINHVKRVLYNLDTFTLMEYWDSAPKDQPISNDLIGTLKVILNDAYRQVDELSEKYSENDQK